MNETLLYIVLSVAAGSLLVSWLASRPNLNNFPVINPLPKSRWGFALAADKQSFLSNARALIKAGIESFQKPFVLNTENGPRIILPPSYADAVKNDPRLSMQATTAKDFFSGFPGFEALHEGNRENIVIDAVRTKLTQNLGKPHSLAERVPSLIDSNESRAYLTGAAACTQALADEATEAIDQRWGHAKDWHTVDLGSDSLYLVAHLSARVFLGEELSHDEEWLKLSIDYTLIIFNAARALRLWPAYLRRVAVWFVPECVKLRETTKRAKQIVSAAVEKRRIHREKGASRINDALEWLHETANGRKHDVTCMQLGLTMAAIHTTTDLTKQCLIDLAQHPDVVEELRGEVSEVLSTSGWEKTALYKMRRLDSAIKETQRMKPAAIVSMNRIALEDVTLPDGTVLPRGSQMVTSSQALWEAHEKGDTYDASRFLKMRQVPGKENSGQLVTISSDHIAFGYGKHACPGRFFAANEVKISLAYILMNYDLKLVDTNADPMPYGFELIVNPMAKLAVRRRA